MAKVCGTIRIVVGLMLLSGCGTVKSLELGNRPTQINPLPVKTALKDSAIIVAIPVDVQKKPTGGYRSLLDFQAEVMLTEPDGIDVPLTPNGLVLGVRGRW